MNIIWDNWLFTYNIFDMASVEEIKAFIDKLKPGEQLEIAQYATTASEKLKETLAAITPITENDKKFIETYKNNPNIQRDKIKLSETTIELNGLKFPRTLATHSEVKDIPDLKLDHNVYQRNGHDYFIFDAVQKICKAGKKIPERWDWIQAAKVFGLQGGEFHWEENYGWESFFLLGQLLNYPHTGLRIMDGWAKHADEVTHLWSSSELHGTTYGWYVCYNHVSGCLKYDNGVFARPVVLLQD